VSSPAPASVIASRDNARVVAARRLHERKHRDRERRFLIEGPHALDEALSANARVTELFVLWDDETTAVRSVVEHAARSGLAPVRISRGVLGWLATTETPQGVVAVCSYPENVSPSSLAPGSVPVLVEVQDPGNVGTVLRSAEASGATGAVLSTGTADLYSPKVVRSSAGSLFHLPVVRDLAPADAVAALRSCGWRILAASADGAVSIHHEDLAGRVAVLFGNEARGLTPEVVALADGTIRIPIEGRTESLNLAAAASVVLFAAARQRSHPAPAGPGDAP
jgi:TrmH family RNA methyltransferase